MNIPHHTSVECDTDSQDMAVPDAGEASLFTKRPVKFAWNVFLITGISVVLASAGIDILIKSVQPDNDILLRRILFILQYCIILLFPAA